jgi:hypothetical protein
VLHAEAASSDRTAVRELLDAFQAAERAGVQALGRWIAACRDPRLRGGLRVLRARDARHAALAEARLRALGGAPRAAVGRDLGAVLAVLANPEVSDRSKVAMLLGRVPLHDRSLLADAAARLAHDPETQALLETIGDDEQSAVDWLRRIAEALEGDGA